MEENKIDKNKIDKNKIDKNKIDKNKIDKNYEELEKRTDEILKMYESLYKMEK